MRSRFIYILFTLAIVVVLASCNTTKYLSNGQSLYKNTTIHLHHLDSSKIKNNDLSEELVGLVRPEPNSTFLGIPFKLWIYNLAGNPKRQAGWRKWLRNKYGEPPVLASYTSIQKTRDIMQNRLENRGYFINQVNVDTVVRRKKMTAVYNIYLDTQYTIRNQKFTIQDTTSPLGKTLRQMTRRWNNRKPGRPYSLDGIKEQTGQLEARLKQRGFYYFSSDYILALADTTVGNHQIDLRYVVKRQTPEEAKKQFRINDIVVFADYTIGADTSITQVKHVEGDSGYIVVDHSNIVRPQVFSRLLGFRKGDLYNVNSHNLALNRLSTLGIYKFVKARFEETDTVKATGGWLNTYYYLTPAPKKSIRFEASGYTKSNNSNGTELSVNWRNKNLFHGAEAFTFKVYGGLEKQVLKNAPDVSTRRIGADASLLIPKILAPFYVNTNRQFVPLTKINLGYEFYTRSDQYTLTSLNTNFGYLFQQSQTKQHQLNVLSFTFVKPTHISPAFQQALDTNVVLRRSIERQFIIGSNYNYTYNSLSASGNTRKKNNYYFNANLDLSGNILGLLTGANVNDGKEKKIFGSPFSQYVRGELNFVHYLTINKSVTWANRILTGLGYSWGNSSTMPFVKSFFVGGPNDLRAFGTRSLGPGSYYAGNPRFATRYLGDQPGDMKLEFNSEIRSKLVSIIQGAAFVDVGNTWLVRNDPDRPGGTFTNNFYKQLAVGSGLGLRFDANILVLRLDLGVPLRSPSENGFEWNFKQMNWSWVQHNWIWNIAIGYPF